MPAAKVLYITNYQREETEFLMAARPWYAQKCAHLWSKLCLPVLNLMEKYSKWSTAKTMNIYSHLHVVK